MVGFLGGGGVSVRGLSGVRVRALGISNVMEIRSRGGETPKPSKWIRADRVCGRPEAGREWKEPRRISPSFERFHLPIPRCAAKLGGIRVRESSGNVDRLDLRYANAIARAAIPR